MSAFTDAELEYLTSEQRLARVATVGKDGTPHVVPTGWSYNPDGDLIEMGGHNLPATKKFRDILRSGRAAVVIDEVLPPWRPRGIEIRGRAEAVTEPAPIIRLHPERIISWGLESDAGGQRHARSVPRASEDSQGPH